MATNPFFSGRIPRGLFDRIEKYRAETNESKSEVLIKALAKYVEYQLEEKASQVPPIREEFDRIYKRLELLEKQLSKPTEQLPKQLEIASDNKLIIDDNKSDILILPTQEAIRVIGVSQASLSSWKNQKLLPKTHKNKKSNQTFKIDIDKEKTKARKIFWRIKTIDN